MASFADSMKEESKTDQNQSHLQSEESIQENWRERLNGSLDRLFLKSGYDGQKLSSEGAVGSIRKKTSDGSELTIWRIQPRSNDPLPLPRWTLQIKSSNKYAVSSNGEVETPEQLRRFELRSNEAGTHLYRLNTDASEVIASETEGADLQRFVDE
jgi:hypothetical protein